MPENPYQPPKEVNANRRPDRPFFQLRGPIVLLIAAAIIHVFAWHPPPEIRWDGTLYELPIPWLVCFRGFAAPLAILAFYASSWAIAISSCCRFGFRKNIPSLSALIAAPVAVYALMYIWYFWIR
jgi:hypothetical protein